VRMRHDEVIEEWSSLVNPECPIPPYIQDFTGITDEMVRGAPRFADLAAMLRDKLAGAVFVAHNARFDYSFLRSEFRRLELNFSARVLCTVKLSRRLFPEFIRHSLDAVMQRHGLTCSARHRALGDAQVLRDFWTTLRREVPHAALESATRHLLAAHKLPAHLPQDLADELPEGRGVYRFFGEDGVLLYVGKSHSLRVAVMAHFASENNESKAGRLAGLVRRVDWRETAGELGALLLEAQWIKQLKPLHNRTKRNAQVVTLGGAAAASGEASAQRMVALNIDLVPAARRTECFGLFQSEKDAAKAFTDIARAQQLCLKVLGLEQSAGSCVAYQMGTCRGACVGKEPLLLHAIRLKLALSALKLKAWPFPGRIALREAGPGSAILDAEMHVFDPWTYLGTARSEEELEVLRAVPSEASFDVDVYKILVRHLSKNSRLDWHDLHDKTAAA
jgi:DNA polymerase III subunit epsilon